MMSDVPTGREGVLFALVNQMARAEGKIPPSGPPTYDREWLLGAYEVARKCLGGPAGK